MANLELTEQEIELLAQVLDEDVIAQIDAIQVLGEDPADDERLAGIRAILVKVVELQLSEAQQRWEREVREELDRLGYDVAEVEQLVEGFGQEFADWQEEGGAAYAKSLVEEMSTMSEVDHAFLRKNG